VSGGPQRQSHSATPPAGSGADPVLRSATPLVGPTTRPALPIPPVAARPRADLETHHAHEVRIKKPASSTPSSGSAMPLAVAGSLALVVGIAGGFGYSTYRDLQSRSAETPLSQFEPTAGSESPVAEDLSADDSSLVSDADDLTREFRGESVAALFQVPAEPAVNPFEVVPAAAPVSPESVPGTPVPPPTTPLPTAASPSAAPATAAGNPFEAQSEPVPTGTETPKPSSWATRDRKPTGSVRGSATPANKPLPAGARGAAKTDSALFAPPVSDSGKAGAQPLVFPGGDSPPLVSQKPFQRPITDGGARGPVTPVQFEGFSPAAATGSAPTNETAAPPAFAPAQPAPTAAAQEGIGFLPENPAPAGVPAAGSSTVPALDFGNSEPTPGAALVPPPAFPAPAGQDAPPQMRRTPAPFAGSDDLNPVPAPIPAAIPPAAPRGFSQQPPNWPREEAAPSDPFRSAPAASPVAGNGQFTGDETVHTVEAGENYWTISRKHYGMGRYFVALAEFNKSRIADPKLLKPGMKVVVPSAAALTEKYAHLISGAAPAKTYAPQTADASGAGAGGQAIQQVGFFVDRSGAPVYRVSEGDTLSDIAQTCLGRSSRWVQIFGLNRDQLKSPNDLKLGMILRLPQDASGVQAAPEASVIR